MLRVYPGLLASVWQTYLRFASIDLALRVGAHFHKMGGSDDLPTSGRSGMLVRCMFHPGFGLCQAIA